MVPDGSLPYAGGFRHPAAHSTALTLRDDGPTSCCLHARRRHGRSRPTPRRGWDDICKATPTGLRLAAIREERRSMTSDALLSNQ